MSFAHTSDDPIASLFGGSGPAAGAHSGAPGGAPANQGTGSSGVGSAPTPQAAVGNGTALASYTFDLPSQYSTDLGVAEPSRAQFNPADGGDISYSADGSSLLPGSNDQIVDLAGQPPSYQSCAADTVIESSAKAAAGSTFCIVEAGQRIAGITVNSIGTTQTGDAYATLSVTVWQNSR